MHLDLNNGWDALKDQIPSGADFIFSHPPYWDIISYEKQRNNYEESDLSNTMPYEEFIEKLNLVNEKIFHSLVYGGRHATLIGDIRKQGKYYSILKDMNWYGELESHIIKIQHNCLSDNKVYCSNSFVPIKHEHLLVFRKNKIWVFTEKVTITSKKNIIDAINITWRDLIQATIQYFQNAATLDDIYDILSKSKKAENNQHVREKIRQVLNSNNNFRKVNDKWHLCLE